MSRKSTDREAAEQTLELITKFIYESNNSVDDMPVYFDPELMPFIALMEYGEDLKDKCTDVPFVNNYRTKAAKAAAMLLRYRGEVDEMEYAALLLSCSKSEYDVLPLAARQLTDNSGKLKEAIQLIDSARMSGMGGCDWPVTALDEDDPPSVEKILRLHYEIGCELREAILSILDGRGHRYCYAVQAGLQELIDIDGYSEDHPEEEEEEEEEEEPEDDGAADDQDATVEAEPEDSDDVDTGDDVDCPKFLCTEEDPNDVD